MERYVIRGGREGYDRLQVPALALGRVPSISSIGSVSGRACAASTSAAEA
jgi:hypothetical protein